MGRKAKGRPPLENGKRDKRIDTRFTQAEIEQIEAMEQTLGVCRTDLIRQRLLGNRKAHVVNASALLLELDKIGAELARAGNNINQLARHANTIRLRGDLPSSLVTAFNGLMEDYVGKQAALEVSLRKIIRAISVR
ncbi:MAG: plasmid mobilization relaxosome protein MobC [Bacteroidetes bacterium]|nr:plasmid mobilization relaxosome protein MobC [Bacteroidota bacterium]